MTTYRGPPVCRHIFVWRGANSPKYCHDIAPMMPRGYMTQGYVCVFITAVPITCSLTIDEDAWHLRA